MRIEIRGSRDIDPNVVVEALRDKGLGEVCDRFGLKVQVFGNVNLSAPHREPEADTAAVE